MSKELETNMGLPFGSLFGSAVARRQKFSCHRQRDAWGSGIMSWVDA